MLEKMVFGGRISYKKYSFENLQNKPYRQYSNPYYMGKTNY